MFHHGVCFVRIETLSDENPFQIAPQSIHAARQFRWVQRRFIPNRARETIADSFTPALEENDGWNLVFTETLDRQPAIGGLLGGERQGSSRNSPIEKELFMLFTRRGIDPQRCGSGLASSVVAIRRNLARELARQIRRNGDIVPRNASIRLPLSQYGIEST